MSKESYVGTQGRRRVAPSLVRSCRGSTAWRLMSRSSNGGKPRRSFAPIPEAVSRLIRRSFPSDGPGPARALRDTRLRWAGPAS
ncbi:hypothetical protein AAFF_G00332290 [Aldrovandia affinis]|uniref:Uncharacterized protein n=1 Tax=Aldrovandia affinis TaxID=143900 RepID=A0AAD7SMP3_9TELE|nr:hypothetical protein AAFF_G00332290 [Aldrovandia affinis]